MLIISSTKEFKLKKESVRVLSTHPMEMRKYSWVNILHFYFLFYFLNGNLNTIGYSSSLSYTIVNKERIPK
jgi:hypothetical protein